MFLAQPLLGRRYNELLLEFHMADDLNSAAITSAICRADGFLSFEILSAASFARVAKLLVALNKGIVAG
jgi:hypothetical protein